MNDISNAADRSDFLRWARSHLGSRDDHEEMVKLRRFWAGRRLQGAEGVWDLPTRSPNGEWMERIAFDLPGAMHLALEARAATMQLSMGHIIRAALVAAGIGEPEDVVGICDGSHSDSRAAADRLRRHAP